MKSSDKMTINLSFDIILQLRELIGYFGNALMLKNNTIRFSTVTYYI